jgi:hypothetical protein
MNVSLLHNDHPYVWATHVSIFRVASDPVIFYIYIYIYIYLFICILALTILKMDT